MDITIAGSGTIAAGEYDNISVSGSGHIMGRISCHNLDTAGSARADEDVSCSGTVSTAGSNRFDGNLTAGSIETAGSVRIAGELTVIATAECAGSTRVGKGIKGGKLKLAGRTEVGTEIEADELHVDGTVSCPGLINAEVIDIRCGYECTVGSLGGTTITVRPSPNVSKNLRTFFNFNKNRNAVYFDVRESIEGDSITLSHVKCPTVTGKRVTVGPHCVLDCVYYSEQVDIDPTATVTHVEQVL